MLAVHPQLRIHPQYTLSLPSLFKRIPSEGSHPGLGPSLSLHNLCVLFALSRQRETELENKQGPAIPLWPFRSYTAKDRPFRESNERKWIMAAVGYFCSFSHCEEGIRWQVAENISGHRRLLPCQSTSSLFWVYACPLSLSLLLGWPNFDGRTSSHPLKNSSGGRRSIGCGLLTLDDWGRAFGRHSRGRNGENEQGSLIKFWMRGHVNLRTELLEKYMRTERVSGSQ